MCLPATMIFMQQMITKLVADTSTNSEKNTQWQGKMHKNIVEMEKRTLDAVKGLEETVKQTIDQLRNFQKESDERMSKFESDLQALAAKLEAQIANASAPSSSVSEIGSTPTRASSVPWSRATDSFGQADAKRTRSAGRDRPTADAIYDGYN